jgi:hypothetical protein
MYTNICKLDSRALSDLEASALTLEINTTAKLLQQ